MVQSENDVLSLLNEKAYLDPYSISDSLKKHLTETVVGQERDNLITEIKCFEFLFQNGELKPTMESIDRSGNRICYPDLSAFTDGELNYLKSRLTSNLHEFPKSRYSHLLWIRTKHNDYGRIAADGYKKLTSIYFNASIKGKELFHKFCSTLQCFNRISIAVKYNLQECKDFLLSWLQNDQVPVTWKDNILDIILDSPLFKQAELNGLTSLMVSFYDGKVDNYFVNEKYLKSCLVLSQKENVSNSKIYNLLGENEMSLANKREDDESGMILISCYQKAAYYFRMAHNDERHDEVSGLYTQQKSKLKLSLFQHDFSPEEVKIMNEEQNAIVDRILSTAEGHPLWHLVYGKELIMGEKKLEEDARRDMKNSFMYFANMQVYDLNNNAKTLNEDDKLNHQKFQNYVFHLQLSTIPIIEKLLYKGIKTAKLTKENIIGFFNQSWLSSPLEGFTSDETRETFSWIELLGPGLFDVLSQLESQIYDKEFKPNFILGIDSLSIKIEGLIRDLARLSGKTVTKIKEGESTEMNLEELLREEEIKKLFNEEDMLLWRYLLTKQGWNIRNNIAHAFYRPGDYNRGKAILLFLAILRLCKYFNIVEQSKV